MLVLHLKPKQGESRIVIDGRLVVKVYQIKGDKVSIAIAAPKHR